MKLLLAFPILVILVAFALTNQQVVRVGLWPTDILVDLPLSVLVLLGAGLFFLAGAFVTWGASLSQGVRARRAERVIRQLEAQIQALRSQRSNPAGLLPPPGA